MKRRREERRVKKKKKNKKKLRLLGGDFLEDNREKRPMDVQTFGEVVHTFIGKMYGGVGFKLFCLHLVFLVLEKNEWEKRLWKRREEKEEREEKGENMAERKLRNRVLVSTKLTNEQQAFVDKLYKKVVTKLPENLKKQPFLDLFAKSLSEVSVPQSVLQNKEVILSTLWKQYQHPPVTSSKKRKAQPHKDERKKKERKVEQEDGLPEYLFSPPKSTIQQLLDEQKYEQVMEIVLFQNGKYCPRVFRLFVSYQESDETKNQPPVDLIHFILQRLYLFMSNPTSPPSSDQLSSLLSSLLHQLTLLKTRFSSPLPPLPSSLPSSLSRTLSLFVHLFFQLRVGGVMGGGGALSESLLSLVSSTNSFFFLLSSLSLVDPPMVMFPVISSVKERLKVMAAILFELLFDRHQQQENKEEEEEEGGLEGGKELSGPIFSLLSSMVGLFEKERGGDGVEEGGFFLKVVMVFKWFLERKPVSKKEKSLHRQIERLSSPFLFPPGVFDTSEIAFLEDLGVKLNPKKGLKVKKTTLTYQVVVDLANKAEMWKGEEEFQEDGGASGLFFVDRG